MKKRFSEEQIIGFRPEVDTGVPLKEVYRKHGFSEASHHLWRASSWHGGVRHEAIEALEAENARLKKLLCWKRGHERGAALESASIGFMHWSGCKCVGAAKEG